MKKYMPLLAILLLTTVCKATFIAEFTIENLNVKNIYYPPSVELPTNFDYDFSYKNEILPTRNKRFVVMEVETTVKWKNKQYNGRIEYQDIALMLMSKKFTAIGAIDPISRTFITSYSSIDFNRGSTTNTITKETDLFLFEIPKSRARRGTFSIAKVINKKLTLPPFKPSNLPSVIPSNAFTLENVSIVKKIDSQITSLGQKASTKIVAVQGNNLIKIVITPKNLIDYHETKRFSFRNDEIGITTDIGGYSLSLGDIGNSGDLSRHGGQYIRKKSSGLWDKKKVTYYFSVPKKAKRFSLMLNNSPVASGVIPKYDTKVKIHREYYSSGVLKSETSMMNAQKHGIEKEFDEQGQLLITTYYDKGVAKGSVKSTKRRD